MVSENFSYLISADTTNTSVFHTVSSGVTRYYQLVLPSDGVTVSLDMTLGSATLYASDNIWNANAPSHDWTFQATSYAELFMNPTTLGRTTRPLLFLAVVGGQTTNTYILNNAVGDTTTKGIIID